MRIGRMLVLVHRWIGVALCLFFAAWFLSGMIMMYVPFPSLAQADRLARSPDISPQDLHIGPAEALHRANVDTVSRFRLMPRAGEPAYLIEAPGRRPVPVSAIDGEVLEPIEPDKARRIGEQFSGQRIELVEGPVDYDQWIVSNDFDSYRPYYRLSVDDREDTKLYVSAVSGEVLQRTRGNERAWNYAGAVVHWIYPTVLRRHWVAWDQVVWWLSLVGIVGALAGIWLGIVRMRASLRLHNRRISPYRDWMRWHHILGLFAGAFVLTWIISGWLSMDHGRLFSEPYPGDTLVAGFQKIPLHVAVSEFPFERVKQSQPFREGELTAVGGVPVWLTRQAATLQVDPLATGAPRGMSELPERLIYNAMQNAVQGVEIVSASRLGPRDSYTNLRAGSLPPETIRFILDDPCETWIHVDPESGEILSVMDRNRRVYRWLYNGLHSLDFPVLVNRRPLWDVTMLTLLVAGFAFSVTAVVIGARRLRTDTRRRKTKRQSS